MVRNSASLLSEIFDILENVVQQIGKTSGLVYVSLAIQPVPPIFTAPGIGKNSFGFGRNEGPLINISLDLAWLHAADDATFEAASKAFIARSQTAARKRGLLHRFEYLNYAAPWQDPIAGYGPAEEKRLRHVSRKYDRAGIFQKAVPGGFKLF